MTTTTLQAVSPNWVRLNRRLWGFMFVGQVSFVLAVLLAQAADIVPARVRLTPQLIALDLMVLAMGVALLVLHRRHPGFSGDPSHDRPQYERNILYPLAMLAAATIFGMAIVLLTGTIWPTGLIPAAGLLLQLVDWPREQVGEEK